MPRLQGKKTAEERLNLTLITEVTQHQSHQKLMSMLALVTCQLHAAGRSVAVANKDSALQVTPALPKLVHVKCYKNAIDLLCTCTALLHDGSV